MKLSDLKNLNTKVIVSVNVLLMICIVAIFIYYNADYNKKLRAENLNNISNINQSSALISETFCANRSSKLTDIVRYSTLNDLTLKETLNYIYESTTPSDDFSVEIVDKDGYGWMADKDENGDFIKADYVSGDYSRGLKKILRNASEPTFNSKVRPAPEFTDNITAQRSFALYIYLSLRDGDGKKAYTLMTVSRSDDVNKMINPDGGYEKMKSVLIDSNGNYLLGASGFVASNFYDFIDTYNGMTLDERNSLMDRVNADTSGALFYNSSRGEEYVYCYSKVNEEGWYCITGVPLSNFHAIDTSMPVALITSFLLLVLLIADVAFLLSLNRRLAVSMKKEKEANYAKSDFLARISHDIRTPLNGIIGTTYLALNEKNSPTTEEYLKVIDTSSKFLLGLVNDVLDMNKVESGKMVLSPEPYSYEDMREYIRAIVLPLCADKGISFNMSGPHMTKILKFDRLRLNQIIFNLLSNSVKFTDPGGHIDFIIDAADIGENKMSVDFTIRDNGIGMSKKFQEHMFEAFTQEEATAGTNIQGTGLGLAIVYNLVNLMNGTIDVKSSPGEGTSFHIYLESEIYDDRNMVIRTNKPVSDEVLKGKRILICEDNEINSMLACKILGAKGMITEVAANGKTGVEMFNDSAPGYYDMILMDIMMPVMDGLTATKEIRLLSHENAETIPIIAMTANAYTEDIQRCLAAGMNAHVAKPINPNVLYSEICRWL